MPSNLITESASGRLAELLREHDREVRDLTQAPRKLVTVPVEFTLFECFEELLLPQNGPGVCRANRMRWDDTQSHVGLDYGRFLELYPWQWVGDVTDGMRPDDPNGETEEIILVDHSRRFSKMVTPEGRVGAYGWAVKMPGSQVTYNDVEGRLPDAPYSKQWSSQVWSILTMQTPGRIQGYADGGLTVDTGWTNINVFRQPVSGTGHVTWDGYDPYVDGDTVFVYNSKGGNNPYRFEVDDGGVLICDWAARLQRYQVIDAEPLAP